MVTEKMLINKFHKNFSFHISTISGIEPNKLSLSSLTLGWAWNMRYNFIKSTIFKSNVVVRTCLIKVIFIGRVLKNSIANH